MKTWSFSAFWLKWSLVQCGPLVISFFVPEGLIANTHIFSGGSMNYCLVSVLWQCTLPPKHRGPGVRAVVKRIFEGEKVGLNSLNLSNFLWWSLPFLNSHSLWEQQLALGHFLYYSKVACVYKFCTIPNEKCVGQKWNHVTSVFSTPTNTKFGLK